MGFATTMHVAVQNKTGILNIDQGSTTYCSSFLNKVCASTTDEGIYGRTDISKQQMEP